MNLFNGMYNRRYTDKENIMLKCPECEDSNNANKWMEATENIYDLVCPILSTDAEDCDYECPSCKEIVEGINIEGRPVE